METIWVRKPVSWGPLNALSVHQRPRFNLDPSCKLLKASVVCVMKPFLFFLGPCIHFSKILILLFLKFVWKWSRWTCHASRKLYVRQTYPAQPVLGICCRAASRCLCTQWINTSVVLSPIWYLLASPDGILLFLAIVHFQRIFHGFKFGGAFPLRDHVRKLPGPIAERFPRNIRWKWTIPDNLVLFCDLRHLPTLIASLYDASYSLPSLCSGSHRKMTASDFLSLLNFPIKTILSLRYTARCTDF